MEVSPWRTVVTNSFEEARLKNNKLVLKSKEGEILDVPIEQIKNLLINSDYGTISLPLLSRLAEQNITVLLCNKSHTPVGEICGNNLHYESAGNLMDQARWTERRKHAIWKQIVHMKIQQQISLLKVEELTVPKQMVLYINSIESNDITNREALAARVYFDTLFGKEFERYADDNINAALNYGYAILRSAIDRAITSYGYNTALGIHHCSRQNKFNLSCDLMEPFRPFVDQIVLENCDRELDWSYKKELIQLLDFECIFDGKLTSISNAIDAFVLDVVKAMSIPRQKVKEIKFAA